jgi:amino acid permease
VRFRLGLDPLWAFTYTAFLVTVISVALRRSTPENDARRRLNLIPLIPMCADLLENALGIAIVTAIPARLDWLAALMGAVSFVKWASLATAHLILLYALSLVAHTMVRRS